MICSEPPSLRPLALMAAETRSASNALGFCKSHDGLLPLLHERLKWLYP